jgi:hypothetical protein
MMPKDGRNLHRILTYLSYSAGNATVDNRHVARSSDRANA